MWSSQASQVQDARYLCKCRSINPIHFGARAAALEAPVYRLLFFFFFLNSRCTPGFLAGYTSLLLARKHCMQMLGVHICTCMFIPNTFLSLKLRFDIKGVSHALNRAFELQTLNTCPRMCRPSHRNVMLCVPRRDEMLHF